jgi:hypothetical protein
LETGSFSGGKSSVESRFCEAAESVFGGLEKPWKKPIYSITC